MTSDERDFIDKTFKEMIKSIMGGLQNEPLVPGRYEYLKHDKQGMDYYEFIIVFTFPNPTILRKSCIKTKKAVYDTLQKYELKKRLN